ncbi:MAG: metalloregulator ArsR/SmtB family transcription factor [Thermoplasmatota archaeon]
MKTNGFLKCIVDDNRRNILLFLEKKQRCVTQISQTLQLEQSLVSHHLNLLKCCGLVKAQQQGKEIYYQLTDKKIYTIIKNIEEISQKLMIPPECESHE